MPVSTRASRPVPKIFQKALEVRPHDRRSAPVPRPSSTTTTAEPKAHRTYTRRQSTPAARKTGTARGHAPITISVRQWVRYRLIAASSISPTLIGWRGTGRPRAHRVFGRGGGGGLVHEPAGGGGGGRGATPDGPSGRDGSSSTWHLPPRRISALLQPRGIPRSSHRHP